MSAQVINDTSALLNRTGLVPIPKYEVRAVWLTTISGLDWPRVQAKNEAMRQQQQEELCRILDKLKGAGINTVLLQTRVRATTIYPSSFEPWDICLTGTAGRSPGYDPLAFAIDECHKRGMELHAWVVTIPVGKWNGPGCTRLRKKYPKHIRKIGDEGYLNPESSQTATYLADICEEITRKYDIDGIHLDYIRYPETWKLKVSRTKGRQYITDIAAAISHRVKALKPWVKMSCSPIGKHDDLSRFRAGGWNARTAVCQDAQAWLRMGLMDQLYPMMYFQGNNFYPFAIDWAEQAAGRTVVSGLGVYMLSPKEKDWPLDVITREMNVVRQLGLGHAYFRSRFFTDDTKGLYTFASEHFDATLALVPPMTWMNTSQPEAPVSVAFDEHSSTLSWHPAPPHTDGQTSYNIYASSRWPVDTDDAHNLMSIHVKDTILRVPANCFYAITATDRYGLESQPVQSHYFERPPTDKSQLQPEQSYLLACDGKSLQLPPLDPQLDISVFAIATLQGHLIKTLSRPMGNALDISILQPGIYQLRSLSRRGNTHLVGYFIVKRH